MALIKQGHSTPSYHWGEDIVFDHVSGRIQQDAGFARSAQCIKDKVIQPLTKTCNIPLRNIFLLGFGQGGMAALQLATAYQVKGIATPISFRRDSKTNTDIVHAQNNELGGVISIGGPLPSAVPTPTVRLQTPVLICGGNSETSITQTALQTIKAAFQNVEYVKWDRSGDLMPRDRAEVLPLMRFWGKRLQSRAGVPEDAIVV